jgi:hypothetical protein
MGTQSGARRFSSLSGTGCGGAAIAPEAIHCEAAANEPATNSRRETE